MNSATMTPQERLEASQEDGSVLYIWRCTRNACYPQGSVGYDDLSARASHYVYGYTWLEAFKQMTEFYPHDIEGFTCTKFAEK